MALLQGRGFSKRFGGVKALEDVNLTVEAGSIVGLIGPNGAGKTTLFNILAGAFPPSAGEVLFNGEAITGMPAYRICRKGIARTFQVTRPFGEMSCLENAAVAVVNRRPGCPRSQWKSLPGRGWRGGPRSFEEKAAKKINVVQKKAARDRPELGHGAPAPMLDEVLGGLDTQEIQEAIGFIRRLRDERNLTVFWIEHVMGAIMQATEKVIVLDQGQVLMEGAPRCGGGRPTGDPRLSGRVRC